MEKVKRNIMLNLLKGLACIGVVFIHVTFPGIVGIVVKKLAAFAVPIFYLTAGYYAYGKNVDTIKRRLFKIIKIFIFAYIVFFLYSAAMAFKNHMLTQWLADNYNSTTLVKYLIFCTIEFAIPLWYLIAQIETYVFWIIILKLKKEGQITKLIPVLFVLQVILATICETMGFDWFWKKNFVTESLSWFLLGYYIHSLPEEKIDKISDKKLTLIGVVGAVIILVPFVLKLRMNFSCVGYIPYATAMFLIALNHGNASICKPLEILGDKLSLWVYIFHVPASAVILSVVHSILEVDETTGIYPWIHPFFALSIVILGSFVFNMIFFKSLKIKKKD